MENLRDKKSNILLSNALFELLKEKNFSQIKISEICDRALVHRTTFYNHFEDKYDLLRYILENIHKDIKSKVNKIDGIVEYYASIARLYIQEIKKSPELFSIAIATNDISSFMFQEVYIKDLEKELAIYKYKIPPRYVAKFYVPAVISLVNEWIRTGMKEDENTIIDYIKDLIVEK